jgi:F0F1-type ATP synthase gamma subunit
LNLKLVVKAMNFHALLHVDAARKKAQKYMRLEQEVGELIDLIINNRNFILDKHTLKVDPSRPALNIYIGSDYGFCGGINYQVNHLLLEDDVSEKIVIGKKISFSRPNVLLHMTREDFDKDYSRVEEQLEHSLKELRHSSINIIYNHFYNTSDIKLRKKQVFPVSLEKKSELEYTEDFVVEGKIDDLLVNLVLAYLNYEVKIAAVNSFASENILRQNTTTESLKKIDEWIEEEQREQRKVKKQKMCKKVLDSYVKMKGFGGNRL